MAYFWGLVLMFVFAVYAVLTAQAWHRVYHDKVDHSDEFMVN